MPKPSEIIQERGWVQNALQDKNGFCILGAMYMACHESPFISAHLGCRSSVLFGQIFETLGDPVRWNNAPGRTKEQVIALLQEFETEFESEAVVEKELVTA